ncbi:hypothetical protein AB1A81_11250 [Bdellovibrio bacteriovorus]|uniref:Uncharacterized protein n=2 Tax=Bdellovibrio bacteriovorus TaxID=959 RepID=Q6MKE4_BDEBA|nr:hypothetical protein [Bdellovibrio bacteriovorus]CAE80263.1 hypothetical protein predicted by Glimmer/Critica [Bdellovibrio bacteriovorus HD100]
MGYELSRVLAPAHKKKKFQIENVSSDELNLLKLANKRVDLAFKKTGKGKEHLNVFNKIMNKEEFHRLVELYFKTHLQN